MNFTPSNRLIFLATSTLSYFILGYYFITALLFPFDNIEFIYSTGIALLFIEVINIHSAFWIFAASLQKSSMVKTLFKISILIIYLFFFIFALFVSNNFYLVITAILSFAAKLFSKKPLPKEKVFYIIYSVLWFMFTIVFVISISDFLARTFSFSSQVTANRPSGTSGIFVEVPQVLMMWGFLYYSLLGLNEIFSYLKDNFYKKI